MSEDNEYVIPESLSIHLPSATFNDLQDSYLWDWVCTHLRLIAFKKGWGDAALPAYHKFSLGKPFSWQTQIGGAEELVNWILDTEASL